MDFHGIGYFQALARYNRWANRRLYEACLAMPLREYVKDRLAFFSSIGNTLNHILVADRIWLARLQGVPPENNELGTILHPECADLWQARQREDDFIIGLFDGFNDGNLGVTLKYTDTEGVPTVIPASMAFGHFFNHQTHHRGQAHNMVSQAGLAPPPLDFSYFYFENNRA